MRAPQSEPEAKTYCVVSAFPFGKTLLKVQPQPHKFDMSRIFPILRARLLKDKNPVEAKRHVLMALAEAPRFRQAHRLLLEIVEDSQQASEARALGEDTQ